MALETPILSVSQLNRHVRSWLEHEMGEVSVEGEVSNLSKPASGHFYFTLKDATAQIRCVYFRNRHTSLDSKSLQNGQQVLTRGHLSLYEARGDYQLIVEQLSDAGQGNLYQQFELLKAKLAALGLFETARKKQIPRFPNCIGVITSASAAALRDVLTTLTRRFPLASVLVYPSDTQGKLAAPQLANAVRQANHDKRCDVLILARGGGSIEDLWAFNDEQLAHAIANSLIPTVSGIGHETDFTIADFVVDLRAPTPTAAAEAVTPDQLDLTALLQTLEARLTKAAARYIQQKKLLLHHEIQKITSPGQLIATHSQTLDYLERHLHRAIRQAIELRQHSVHLAATLLRAKHPRLLLQQTKRQVQQLELNLTQAIMSKYSLLKQQLVTQLVTLHTVSPLATLDRGYALVTHHNRLIVDSHQVGLGDVVTVRLAKGILNCEVSGVVGIS